MTTALQRYVFWEVAGGVAVAVAVITTMVVLVDFVELMRTLGDEFDVSPIRLAGFALLRAPALLETTLVFAVLFGSMLAMFRLNRRSELIVMRASGMSAWRFIAPAVMFAFLFGVLATTVINPAAARLTAEFERQESLLRNPMTPGIMVSEGGVWLREGRSDGQLVLRAAESRDGGQLLEDVTVFQYFHDREERPVFARRFDAEQAELAAGFWRLTNAWETAPNEEPVLHAEVAFPTELDPEEMVDRSEGPRSLNFWELREHANLLREAGFAHEPYALRWHRLLALPISLAAMAVLASAASLGHARRGGAFRLAAFAAIIGFAVYFSDTMLASLGSARVLQPAAAAWAAPAFTLLAGLFVVASVEDG